MSMYTHIFHDVMLNVMFVIIFIFAKIWKQCECPSVGGYVPKD